MAVRPAAAPESCVSVSTADATVGYVSAPLGDGDGGGGPPPHATPPRDPAAARPRCTPTPVGGGSVWYQPCASAGAAALAKLVPTSAPMSATHDLRNVFGLDGGGPGGLVASEASGAPPVGAAASAAVGAPVDREARLAPAALFGRPTSISRPLAAGAPPLPRPPAAGTDTRVPTSPGARGAVACGGGLAPAPAPDGMSPPHEAAPFYGLLAKPLHPAAGVVPPAAATPRQAQAHTRAPYTPQHAPFHGLLAGGDGEAAAAAAVAATALTPARAPPTIDTLPSDRGAAAAAAAPHTAGTHTVAWQPLARASSRMSPPPVVASTALTPTKFDLRGAPPPATDGIVGDRAAVAPAEWLTGVGGRADALPTTATSPQLRPAAAAASPSQQQHPLVLPRGLSPVLPAPASPPPPAAALLPAHLGGRHSPRPMSPPPAPAAHRVAPCAGVGAVTLWGGAPGDERRALNDDIGQRVDGTHFREAPPCGVPPRPIPSPPPVRVSGAGTRASPLALNASLPVPTSPNPTAARASPAPVGRLESPRSVVVGPAVAAAATATASVHDATGPATIAPPSLPAAAAATPTAPAATATRIAEHPSAVGAAASATMPAAPHVHTRPAAVLDVITEAGPAFDVSAITDAPGLPQPAFDDSTLLFGSARGTPVEGRPATAAVVRDASATFSLAAARGAAAAAAVTAAEANATGSPGPAGTLPGPGVAGGGPPPCGDPGVAALLLAAARASPSPQPAGTSSLSLLADATRLVGDGGDAAAADALRHARTASARNAALEAKIASLEGALERAEDDYTREVDRHRLTKQRLAEVGARVGEVAPLQQQLRALQVSCDKQAAQLRRLRELDEHKDAQRDEARAASAFDARRRRELEDDARAQEQRVVDLQAQVHTLSTELTKTATLEGQLQGLRGLVDRKSDELAVAAAEARVLRGQLAESEAEAAEALALRSVAGDAERLRAANAALEADVLHLTGKLADAAKNCETAKALRTSDVEKTEAQVVELKQQLALLQGSYAALQVAHQTAVADADALLAESRGAADRRQHADAAAATLRRRVADAEVLLTSHEAELERLKQELVDNAVAADEARREAARLQHELDCSARQHALTADHAQRCADDAAGKAEMVSRLEERERRRGGVIDDLRGEVVLLTQRAEEAAAAAAEERGRREAAEAQLVVLREQEARSDALEAKLRALEAACDAMVVERDALLRETEDLKGRLHAKEVEAQVIPTLQEAAASLQQRADSQARTIDHHEAEAIAHEATLRTMQAELAAVLQRAAHLSDADAAAQQHIARLEEQLAHLRDVERAHHTATARLDDVEAALRARDADVEAERVQSQTLAARVAHLEAAVKDATADAHKQLTVAEAVRAELAAAAAQQRQAEGEVARRREVEGVLREELDVLDAAKARLTEEVRLAAAARTELEARVQDVQAEAEGLLADAHAEKSDARREAAAAVATIRVLEADLAREQQSAQRAAADTVALRSERQELLQRVAALEATVGRTTVELDDARTAAASGEALAHATQRDLRDAHHRLQDVETALAAAQRQADAVRVERDHAAAQATRLEDLLGEANARIEQVLDAAQAAKAELAGVKQDVAAGEQRLAVLEREKLQMQKAVDSLDARYRESQTHAAQLAAALKASEEQYEAVASKHAALDRTVQDAELVVGRLKGEQAMAASSLEMTQNEAAELRRKLHAAAAAHEEEASALRAERATLEASHAALRRRLEDAHAAEQEKEKTLKQTIAVLTQKSALADETLQKFEDFNTYNVQLRDSNGSLREELLRARAELDRAKDQVLELQTQLAAVQVHRRM